MNDDDRTMLALAALTYRGFGHHSEEAVERALRPWLPELAAEGLGNWELAWGPAAFRTRTSLFDDAMIYVARQRDRAAAERPRYAIAIRGTNPVSVFDWVFGDLWVRLQVDWDPAGSTAAKLSASTALGLAITQHLAAETPPSTAGRLAPIGNALANTLQEFAHTLPELEPDRLLRDPGLLSDDQFVARVNALTDRAGEALRSRVLGRLFDRFGGLTQALQDAVDQRVMDALLRYIAAAQGPGETLLEFLNRAVEPDASVAVTGHSKGGALAIAAALWLLEQWPPAAHQAEIECFSFAGPTAGNAAFAERYNARLAQRTRRIVNRLDIVPQAWDPENLRALEDFYPVLRPAVKQLSSSVGPLSYTHVGGQVVEIASKEEPGNLIQRIIHQHLDAYLADAGFKGPKWNARSIFLE